MAEDLTVEIMRALTDLRSEMTAMRSEINAMRSDMTAGFAAVRQDIAALEKSLDDVRLDMAGVRQDVAAVRSELVSVRSDIMAHIDRLQNRFDAVRDDLTVNYGANEHTERLARNALEKTRTLSEMINAMQRQVRRISAKVFGAEDEAA